MLDEKKLKHDIFENESASFRDEKGELICVAMRDFCSDRGITTWADRIVLKNVEMEKNIWVSGAARTRIWTKAPRRRKMLDAL